MEGFNISLIIIMNNPHSLTAQPVTHPLNPLLHQLALSPPPDA